MPALLVYLLKLSVSLSVVYLFYYLVLRKLTFYNHNRWYLLGYTLLSFFIPLVNISPLLEKNNWSETGVVNWVPVMVNNSTVAVNETASHTANYWQVAVYIVAAGMLLMLIRLVRQLISLRSLLLRAKPISNEGITLYELESEIGPFSFGNGIYVHPGRHSEAELSAIIRHEMVHVKQRHSIDIIWGEVLCLLNWYNPFAWLIRKAIRQNLEFIADNKVLEKGADKKQYQYLLLSVTGNMQYSVTAPFKFSSLKKRIVMMNKLRSARTSLFRFLFLLPLLAVVLLSFRNHFPFGDKPAPPNTIRLGAIVYDEQTHQPVPGVLVKEEISGLQTYSDDKGYFSFDFPAEGRKVEKHLWMHKDGYQRLLSSFSVIFNEGVSDMGLIGVEALRKGSPGEVCPDCISRVSVKEADNSPGISYKNVEAYFRQFLRQQKQGPANDTWIITKDNQRIRVEYDTIPDRSSSGLRNFLQRNSQVQSVSWRNKDDNDALWIIIRLKNGGIEEYNLEDPADVKKAKAKYGDLPAAPPPPPAPPAPPAAVTVEGHAAPTPPAAVTVEGHALPAPPSPVLEERPIATAAEPAPVVIVQGYRTRSDAMPVTEERVIPDVPGIPAINSFPENVKKIEITNKAAKVWLKNGKQEKYDLTNPEEKKQFELKYGPVRPAAPTTTPPRSVGSGAAVSSTGSGTPLMAVDGSIRPAEEVNKMDPNTIARVDVTKGQNAVATWGDAGRNGVVNITTKPIEVVTAASLQTTSDRRQVTLTDAQVNIGQTDKLIVLDGKVQSVRSITLKGNYSVKTLTETEATRKYGTSGKNGAIEIVTQH